MILHDLTLEMHGRTLQMANVCHTVANDPAPIHDITWGLIADILEKDGVASIESARKLR